MLKSGQVFDEIFLVRQKQLAHKKDGNPYLVLTLADRTGSIKAMVWDNVQDINGNFGIGDYVKVKGAASDYRDMLQVTVRDLERCGKDSIATEDFLPHSDRDPDDMMDHLVSTCSVVENSYLKKLLMPFLKMNPLLNLLRRPLPQKICIMPILGGYWNIRFPLFF